MAPPRNKPAITVIFFIYFSLYQQCRKDLVGGIERFIMVRQLVNAEALADAIR